LAAVKVDHFIERVQEKIMENQDQIPQSLDGLRTLTGIPLKEAILKLDEELPREAYAPLSGERDLTDINPNYMRKVLNETFGLCGLGWGYSYQAQDLDIQMDKGTIPGAERSWALATLSHLEFWYLLRDGQGSMRCVIHASGGSENSTASYAMKGAITNAIGNAVSNIGFQESVYLGKRSHHTVGTGRPAAPPAREEPGEAEKITSRAPSEWGSFTVNTAGALKHQGKQLSELSQAALEHYANLDGRGLNLESLETKDREAAQALQQAARLYVLERSGG
jgi:hypothetical protein